jgi:serine protease Do
MLSSSSSRKRAERVEGQSVKSLLPCHLLKAVFLTFILMEVVCMFTLRASVQASEGSAPVGLSTAIARVAKQNIPAVVHIEVTQRQKPANPRVPSVKSRLGAEVRLLTSKEVERYGIRSTGGVAIIWLDPHGPLARAGFEVNDVVLEINGEAVEDLEGFMGLASSLRPNQRITLLALDHRSGRTGYVQVVVPQITMGNGLFD